MKILQYAIVIGVIGALAFSILTKAPSAKGSESVQKKSDLSMSTLQYVLFSFDGSKSIQMWEDTRTFAKKMRGEGKPLNFTYFINSIYFLTKEYEDVYKSPRGERGVSMIGFAESEQDVANRIQEINLALTEGHEIGSHTAGHFVGGDWTEEEWKEEFSSFANLITHVKENNPHITLPELILKPQDIVGFRAPDLGVDAALYKTLSDLHFKYDASGVGMPDKEPVRDQYGIWHIPLSTILIGDSQEPGIAMDYSLRMHQTRGEDVLKKDTPEWNEKKNEVVAAYMEYFERNYKHKRAPLVIGHHFSLWNDGLYWEAMKTFAEKVCGLPDVKCSTFKEYVDYLNLKNGEPLVKKQ